MSELKKNVKVEYQFVVSQRKEEEKEELLVNHWKEEKKDKEMMI
jgi:hypothetical protein